MSETAREVLTEELYPVTADAGWPWPTARLADDIIAALNAAGFVIVPKEPTDAMKRAWQGPESWDQDALEIWQALIAAAQEPKP